MVATSFRMAAAADESVRAGLHLALHLRGAGSPGKGKGDGGKGKGGKGDGGRSYEDDGNDGDNIGNGGDDDAKW